MPQNNRWFPHLRRWYAHYQARRRAIRIGRVERNWRRR
mgnify:FL=1